MKDPMIVSFCISTYNRHTALRLCLESVLTQTRMPDEILVGDDGSTEETIIGSFMREVHYYQSSDQS